jgi:hypothetical protein
LTEIFLFTLFAMNCHGEQVSDAFLVEDAQLVSALNALMEVGAETEDDRLMVTYVEVHGDSVRDSLDRRPVPWLGNPRPKN